MKINIKANLSIVTRKHSGKNEGSQEKKGKKQKGKEKKGKSSTTASISKPKLSTEQPGQFVKEMVENSTAADNSREKGKGVDSSKKVRPGSFKAAGSAKITRKGPKGGSEKDQIANYLSKGPTPQQPPMAAPPRPQSSKVPIRTSKRSQDSTNIETHEDE